MTGARLVRSAACAVLGLLVVACTSVADIEERMASEHTATGADVAARTGVDVPAPVGPVDDTGPFEVLRARLAEPLDEASAIKIALVNNRSVRAAFERVGIARAELEDAGLLPNPTFDGDAEFFAAGTDAELQLMQSILDIFLLPLHESVAEADLVVARCRAARDMVGLIFDVRRALLDVRIAEESVAVRTQGLEGARAAVAITLRLHAAGNVPDADLVATQSLEAEARLDLAAAELAVSESRVTFEVLLGLWGADLGWRAVGQLAADLERVAEERPESRAVEVSLDLAEARARIDGAARRAGIEDWTSLLPEFSSGVDATRDTDGAWGVGPVLSLEVPLFNQGQARRAGAAARLRLELANYWSKAVEIRAAARRLCYRHLALRDRVVYMRDVDLPLRAKLVRETLRNYNAMQSGAFDVLVVRRQEVDAYHQYLETLRMAWESRLDFEELMAGRLDARRMMSMAVPSPASAPPGGAKEH